MTERRGPPESLRPSARSLRSLAQHEGKLLSSKHFPHLEQGLTARVEGRTISMREFCETNPIRSFRVRICPPNAVRVRKSNSTNQSQFYEWDQGPRPRQSQFKPNP